MSKKGTADPFKFFSLAELETMTAPGKQSPEARQLAEIASILETQGTRNARAALRDYREGQKAFDPMQALTKAEQAYLTSPDKDVSQTNLLKWIADEIRHGNPDSKELLRLYRQAKKEKWKSVSRNPALKKMTAMDRLISYRKSDGESFDIDPRDGEDSDIYEAA